MKFFLQGRLVVCLLILLANSAGADEAKNSRTFLFRYGATLTGLAHAKQVRVWVPLPSENAAQKTAIARRELPAVSISRETVDQTFGNKILYFAFAPQEDAVPFRIDHHVTRREVRALDQSSVHEFKPLNDVQRRQFLQSNNKVPTTGKPLALLPDFTSVDVIQSAKQIYDRVDSHVAYDKSKPGYGFGDVLWVCDSRTGNCTDFHSLFISMARSQSIPARFEIGFPIPTNESGEVAGYHCWASFFDDARGWIPVDISEADKHPELKDYYFGNLTKDRVGFSIGRDIRLEPPQDGPALNYFIYPYVEVDGKPWPKEKLKLKFEYRDVVAQTSR